MRLIAISHEVLSALAVNPKASDEELLGLALQDERILITEDKDFGELVFVRGLPHGPIIRLVELTVDEQVTGMGELLDHHATQLTGRVIATVSRGRIRIRR